MRISEVGASLIVIRLPMELLAGAVNVTRPSTKCESGSPSGGVARLQLPEKWRIRRSLSQGSVDRDCVPREAPTLVRQGGHPSGLGFSAPPRILSGPAKGKRRHKPVGHS